MKNTLNASTTQKAMKRATPSTCARTLSRGAHGWGQSGWASPPAAGGEAHHRRGGGAGGIGVRGVRESGTLSCASVGGGEGAARVDEHADRPAGGREALQLALGQHQRLG